MTTSHVLRTDGGGSLGFGHINRCLILADAIRNRGGKPEIVLGSESVNARTHVSRTGHAYRELDSSQAFEATSVLRDAEHAVFDFSHRDTRGRIDDAQRLLAMAYESGARTLLIDAKGAECLSAMAEMKTNILAIPYAGAENEQVLPGAETDVRGLPFFAIDNKFLKLPTASRLIPEKVERILVTAGGSDPVRLTLFFLDVLEEIATPLEVHVVIGPGFDPKLTAEITVQAKNARHQTRLVRAPETLADEIFRADIALSATGLTKYELAYTGTPCVLVSIDENHAIANRPFAALGSSIDMGEISDTNVGAVASELEKLIGDTAARRKLANAGPKAIDGAGAQRLLDLLHG
jgi:spore coat polysaccharide biosynthesis predicted glycosyltransferase SpsG